MALAQAYITRDRRRVLDLVEDRARPDLLHEGAGVGANPRHDIKILEEPLRRTREQSSEEGGLPRPPRTRDDQPRDVAGGAPDLHVILLKGDAGPCPPAGPRPQGSRPANYGYPSQSQLEAGRTRPSLHGG